MKSDLDQIIAERDQVTQEWQNLSQQVDDAKRKSWPNNPWADAPTEADIIANARILGMRTEEEFQTALQLERDKMGGYSKALWLLLVPVIFLVWFLVKKIG
jgi:hypothetical protein